MLPTTRRNLIQFAALSLILGALLGLSSCTVAPHLGDGGKSVAVSGNNTDGGILGDYGHGPTFKGFIVDDWFVDQYNSLMLRYGGTPQIINGKRVGFNVAIKKDAGLTAFPLEPNLSLIDPETQAKIRSGRGNLRLIDIEHMTDYRIMTGYADNNIPPQSFIRGLAQ